MRTLRAGPAAVVVDATAGGRLSSLTLEGVELIGGADPSPGSPAGWYHGSFPMAPYAGRLKKGVFHFDGASYAMPPNDGDHAGHGIAFDVPWSVDDCDPSQLALSTKLDARWPFGGRLGQTFILDENSLTTTLTAYNDERDMPVSLGFHPWLRRDIGSGGPASIAFAPTVRYVPDSDGFARDPSVDLGERPWDDVFSGVHTAPTVSWPNGPRLTITSDAEYWIVYERRRSGFCIEPITTPPDTLGRYPAARVTPDAPLSITMTIGWELGGGDV